MRDICIYFFRGPIVICDLLSALHYIVGVYPVDGQQRAWETCATRTPYARHNDVPATHRGTTQLIIPTTETITQILSVHWSLIEVIHTIVQVEVKEQLVHVTTTTVLAKVQIPTTGLAIMLQVTHGSGHVLDPV